MYNFNNPWGLKLLDANLKIQVVLNNFCKDCPIWDLVELEIFGSCILTNSVETNVKEYN